MQEIIVAKVPGKQRATDLGLRRYRRPPAPARFVPGRPLSRLSAIAFVRAFLPSLDRSFARSFARSESFVHWLARSFAPAVVHTLVQVLGPHVAPSSLCSVDVLTRFLCLLYHAVNTLIRSLARSLAPSLAPAVVRTLAHIL